MIELEKRYFINANFFSFFSMTAIDFKSYRNIYER